MNRAGLLRTGVGGTALLGLGVQTDRAAVALPLGQIAANEAQQQGALATLVGRQAIGSAFAAAPPIDVVSAALDGYES